MLFTGLSIPVVTLYRKFKTENFLPLVYVLFLVHGSKVTKGTVTGFHLGKGVGGHLPPLDPKCPSWDLKKVHRC